MATKRAKILTETQLQDVLYHIQHHSPQPESGRLKMLLSHRAGLRACEIAALTIEAVTTPEGKIGKYINLYSQMTKNGKERQISMHPDIAHALKDFRQKFPEARRFALGHADAYQSVNSITVWFINVYKRVGLEGCSSHSGRRSFLTRLAQQISVSGGSLRDVQQVAGHARLETTERYLEPSNRQAAMIALLGDRRLDSLHTDEYQDPHTRRACGKTAQAITMRAKTGVGAKQKAQASGRRPRPHKARGTG